LMAPIASEGGVVDLILKALRDLNLEPRVIPRGRIDELRGGSSCFDLKPGETIDAAILLGKQSYAASRMGESEAKYRIDYAVRGTIGGVLPRRVLTRTTPELKGLLRRRVVGLRWEIPLEDRGEGRRFPYLRSGGRTPGPGELWEEGPHQKLTEKLNGDAELMESLMNFVEGGKGDPLIISVFSDGWGASIRISGNLWLRTHELLAVYTSPAYLGIAERIGGHIKEVRRSFGGLAF